MTRYTYAGGYAAHYGEGLVTIPDQVFVDQRAFAEVNKAFPAFSSRNKVRVRLDAEAYGLFTGGTGDPVVRSA